MTTKIAFSQKALLSLVTLLILATSQAHGLMLSGLNVTTLTFNAEMSCQPDPAAAPVSSNTLPLTGAAVNLLNNGIRIISGTTDLNGRVTMNINNLLTSRIRNMVDLSVQVPLPIASCPIFNIIGGLLEGEVEEIAGPGGRPIIFITVPKLGMAAVN